MTKQKKTLLIIGAVLLLAFATVAALLTFITDFLWFREVGYTSVFLKELTTQLTLGVPTFLVITLLNFLYLLALKKSYYKKCRVDGAACTVKEKHVNLIALGVSAVFGLLTTLNTVTALWYEILQFVNSTEYGLADPIFNQDISFYLFRYDFLQQMVGVLIGVVLAFVLVSVVFYGILLMVRKPMADFTAQEESADPEKETLFGKFVKNSPFGQTARDVQAMDGGRAKQFVAILTRQLQVLGVLFFLLMGVSFWLKQYSLLYSDTGLLYGAGYTDITITLNVYRVLMVLSALAAVFFLVGVQKKKLKTALLIPVLMILVSVAGGGIASAVQSLVVAPDEISKESQYLANNIQYTQHAYDLADIEIRDFAASANLTAEDINNNLGTITNIRINDFDPAEKFYNQTQSIRSYYTFNDVDVDRYMIDGEYTQTFLSAREIDQAQIASQPWLSLHLKYTHGYGITLSRVDRITESGQPEMLVSGVPPVSVTEDIQVDQPAIYFGESTDHYIVVNTSEQEFDYPLGDSNAYTTYEGDAGIPLTFFNRLLFSAREQSMKLLVSTNITEESRIIINRNIMDRVQMIAPFLSYDGDPYIVAEDGKLYWIIDAYTYSSNFPYSEPYSEKSDVNYIRNSIKVIVDAYNGDVNFYLVDEEDPIAKTLQKIYPGLLQDAAKMPQSLQAHLRYPNTLFGIQAEMYAKYHMNDVEVFYQSEDKWNIANEMYGTAEQPMTPQYYILNLPGEDHVEFISSIPYTPAGKQNMTALLVMRNDGAHYGEMILYQLPKSRVTYGPRQIESQIDQDTKISQDFSLWSQAGSNYIRGNMFVIPIEDSLIYVEPIYLEASSSSLPEVKRVIVYYNEQLAYAETLNEALMQLFGDYTDPGTSDDPADDPSQGDTPGQGGEGGTLADMTMSQLAKAASEAYEQALQAQRNGDWASYGKYLKELEIYLNELNLRAE
ncbi:MAG: UPF0182 family protein [Clostridiales bacterium]|nr:UPF0182 family protein [Clostridiales bacterium]